MISSDLSTPSRMATDGTTTANFVNPYRRLSSKMVRRYT